MDLSKKLNKFWFLSPSSLNTQFKISDKSSSKCGAAISAADEGVGALRSETKSAIVKSVSCPHL